MMLSCVNVSPSASRPSAARHASRALVPVPHRHGLSILALVLVRNPARWAPVGLSTLAPLAGDHVADLVLRFRRRRPRAARRCSAAFETGVRKPPAAVDRSRAPKAAQA